MMTAATKVRKIAHKYLREEIGNGPSILEIESRPGGFEAILELHYPITVTDDEHKKKHYAFMHLKPVGSIILDHNGVVVTHSSQSEIRKRVFNILADYRREISKIIIRTGANMFSRIAWPQHRNSPTLDVLARLLLEGHLYYEDLTEADYKRYEKRFDILADLELIRRTEDRFLQGNVLIQMMKERKGNAVEAMYDSIAYIFQKAYDKLFREIGQTLNPYLNLNALFYENSLLAGTLVPMYPSTLIAKYFEEIPRVRSRRLIQIDRYILQMVDVDLFEIRNELIMGRQDMFASLSAERGVLPYPSTPRQT